MLLLDSGECCAKNPLYVFAAIGMLRGRSRGGVLVDFHPFLISGPFKI